MLYFVVFGTMDKPFSYELQTTHVVSFPSVVNLTKYLCCILKQCVLLVKCNAVMQVID